VKFNIFWDNIKYTKHSGNISLLNRLPANMENMVSSE